MSACLFCLRSKNDVEGCGKNNKGLRAESLVYGCSVCPSKRGHQDFRFYLGLLGVGGMAF